MISRALDAARRLDRGVAVQAALVVGAYLFSGLTLLVVLFFLRRTVSAVDLRAALGFFFISAVTAGLEPGGAKAAALQPQGAAGRPRWSYLLVAAAKALGAAPIVALVWRFADPQTPWTALALLPLVCAAGFWVTDLRVLLDLEGRHVAAVGLKQGALSGGHALAGLLLILGTPLDMAIGVATLARLCVAAIAASVIRHEGGGPAWKGAWAMLCDLRWIELAAASVLGAASGSADRVLGLRYLSAGAYGSYYLTFEALSRFWLIPYLFTPILFALSVSGREGHRVATGARLLTAVAGLGLIVGVWGVFIIAPGLVRYLVGAVLPLPTLALSLAVVLGSFAQLRVAQLQAAGWSRLVLVITAVSGVVSIACFLFGALRYGAAGLMCAWTVRAAFELALVSVVGSADHGPSRPAVRHLRV
jgi:hypothetical protein